MLVFKWLFIKKIKIRVSYQVDVSCPRYSLFWRTVVLFWNSSYISLKDHFLPRLSYSDIYRHLQLTLFRL